MATIVHSPDGEITRMDSIAAAVKDAINNKDKPKMDKDEKTVVNGPATQGTAKAEANNRYVAITLTDELAKALDAKRGETSRGLFARELVAKALGVTIEIDRHAPRKYATKEEKDAALKARREATAKLMRTLKQAHQARMAGDADKAAELDAEATKLMAIVNA